MRRTTLIAVVAALALVAGACGGGSDDSDKASSKRDSTTTSLDSSSSSSTTDGASTPTGGVGSATTLKGATATTAKKSVAPAPTAAPDPNAVPASAKAGTYDYSQSGTTPDGPVPSHGTLVVSGGTYNRYYDTSKAPQQLVFNFAPNGPHLTKAIVAAKGISITCTFGSPVPLPPWPPDTGKTFSGNATCTNGITASLSGSITSRSGDIVGIASTLHVKNANSSIDITAHDTESWSISLRVPKSSHQTFSGKTPFGPVSGDVTSTLTSTP